MSFVTRLVERLWGDSGGDSGAGPPSPDGRGAQPERFAVAALLVHVARVDGRLDGPERVALVVLLADRFGLTDEAAAALLARADRLDREVDDIAGLIDMLGHETHAGDRTRLLAMAYGIAVADGAVQEFEEDLVWRMGHLLGFDDDAIAAIRAASIGRGPER